MHAPCVALHSRQGPCREARAHRSHNLILRGLEHEDLENLHPPVTHTSLMPGSTARQRIASFPCNAPGNASQNARARIKASVLAFRMMTDSSEECSLRDHHLSSGARGRDGV